MRKHIDPSTARWTKSSLSTGGENCLEIAFLDDVVALRDSKDISDPDAQILVISMDDYKVFIQGVERGELRP